MHIRGREISMIFQESFSSLNPLMKIGEQISETLVLHGQKNLSENKKRVLDLMERLRLPSPEKLYDTYPHNLSGGMCQRVMIAMALVLRPRLLIADEPTTALDVNTQKEIIKLLKEINRDFGTSILFISHDLSLVRDFCKRVLVMYSGRILEEGNTEDIFSNSAHVYTRSLLGSIPGKARRGEALAVIAGKIPSLEEGRPPGCPFHPRCIEAEDRCKTEFPPAIETGQGHSTHCIKGNAIWGGNE